MKTNLVGADQFPRVLSLQTKCWAKNQTPTIPIFLPQNQYQYQILAQANTQYQYQYPNLAQANTQYQYQYSHSAQVNTQYQYQYSGMPQSQYQYQYWSKHQYLNTKTNTFP